MVERNQRFLKCTRRYESDGLGGYRAIGRGPARGHYGAYQFSIRTWNWSAKRFGLPHLVGVRPDFAAPAEQDLMAALLYEADGNRHWEGRC